MNSEQNKLLSKMKKLIKQGKRRFQIRKDRNYIDDLLEIGITVEEAWNQILSLNCNYFFYDTLPNYKTSSNSLIFKKKINNILIYIKLKLEIENDNEEIVVCLSFHKDNKKKVIEDEMSVV